MFDYLLGYDKEDPVSIETYSQKLVGKSFREIWEEDEAAKYGSYVAEDSVEYGSSDAAEDKKNKENLGQIIEERFFIMSVIVIQDLTFQKLGLSLRLHHIKSIKTALLQQKSALYLQ